MTKNAFGSYHNGNTIVTIMRDGTKIRFTPDGEVPSPVFPESMDIKITNRCLGNNGVLCPMCHEMSSPDGEHADLSDPILNTIHPHTELAIGGGNPLTHPDLIPFLRRMKDRGVICNMTVAWWEFDRNFDMLFDLCNPESGLISGLGVSVNTWIPEDVVDMLTEIPNVVVHSIAGMVHLNVLESLLADRGLNLLLLGYKNYGNGEAYLGNHPTYIVDKIANLRHGLPYLFDRYRAISFDNLAIDQLAVRQVVTGEQWQEFYMGDEGIFTMYLDLVKKEYAVSSTSLRHPFEAGVSIPELFARVREEASRHEKP